MGGDCTVSWLLFLLSAADAAHHSHHYNVCDDVDQYFQPEQRTIACYSAAYVRAVLRSAEQPLNVPELTTFLDGAEVRGVHVPPEQRSDYLKLHVNGTRLAAQIRDLLVPFQQQAKGEDEDAVVLGLFLSLYGGAGRVALRSRPAHEGGVHYVSLWVVLLVLAPSGVVGMMRRSALVAETSDDRLALRRLKRRDKQVDDPDSDDEFA